MIEIAQDIARVNEMKQKRFVSEFYFQACYPLPHKNLLIIFSNLAPYFNLSDSVLQAVVLLWLVHPTPTGNTQYKPVRGMSNFHLAYALSPFISLAFSCQFCLYRLVMKCTNPHPWIWTMSYWRLTLRYLTRRAASWEVPLIDRASLLEVGDIGCVESRQTQCCGCALAVLCEYCLFPVGHMVGQPRVQCYFTFLDFLVGCIFFQRSDMITCNVIYAEISDISIACPLTGHALVKLL